MMSMILQHSNYPIHLIIGQNLLENINNSNIDFLVMTEGECQLNIFGTDLVKNI